MKGEFLILLSYADDLFLIGEKELITHCKLDLAREFGMKDLGFDALLSRIRVVPKIGRYLA